MISQTRICPAGCGPLMPFDFRGVRLDRCLECAGIWFDASEYESLSRLPEAALRTLDVAVEPISIGVGAPHIPRSEDFSRRRECPVDGAPLRPIRVTARAAAALDRCDRCEGYWADDSELAALSAALESGKPYFAPSIADETRRELADAMAESLSRRHEIHLSLFQTLCWWLTRPIGPGASSSP